MLLIPLIREAFKLFCIQFWLAFELLVIASFGCLCRLFIAIFIMRINGMIEIKHLLSAFSELLLIIQFCHCLGRDS